MTTGPMILDFHARLIPQPDAAQRLLNSMDAAGVHRTGLAAGGIVGLEELARNVAIGGQSTNDADNDKVLAACRESGGRLLPVYFANPHGGAAPYRDAAPNFAGVEFSPAVHGVRFDDSWVEEIIDVARLNRHSVYTVCLSRPGVGVAELAALAKRHDDVDFVLGHGGVSLIDVHAVEGIAEHPNVYFETCGPYTEVIRAALRRLGADRLVFAAEHPLQPVRVELAKLAELNMSTTEWNSVTRRTGGRLFGIEDS